MEPDVSYSDLVLYDYAVEKSARFVHMGHWDNPRLETAPSLPELIDAQRRMNEIVLELLDVHDGMSVMDVGCGLGGSLESLDRTMSDVRLLGVNIDLRQLVVAANLRARAENDVGWTNADGCSLPVRGASFDRVLCLEALPHFGSRERFFAEAARVLRPGGRLSLADILFASTAAESIGMSSSDLGELLDRHLGPWPDPFDSLEEVDRVAGRHGLRAVERIDATRQTAPTHLVAFADDPKETPGYDKFLDAVGVFRRLHEAGELTYTYTAYQRADHVD